MTFQIVSGTNNSGSLTDVTPQPRCSGFRYARVQYTGSNVYRDGQYQEWDWGYMTRTRWAALLTQIGATSATKRVAVTVRTVSNDYTTFANYNAVAILPELGDGIQNERGTWVSPAILLRDFEAL